MLVFDSLEQFGMDRIVLRIEDLDSKTIMRISIDAENLKSLIKRKEIAVIEECDISINSSCCENCKNSKNSVDRDCVDDSYVESNCGDYDNCDGRCDYDAYDDHDDYDYYNKNRDDHG